MTSNKKPQSLEQRVHKFILENKLVIAGQKILIAVSGGPDSVCLLHILHQLQKDLGITLHIAHLNHQLRGEEAAADALYVKRLARHLKIPCTLGKLDVAAYQATHHLSLEEAAREVRYAFLVKVAWKVRADYVAAGHTLNDQVETLLLHIIRGTGTQGLRGLQPSHTLQFAGNRLVLIRPLLEIKRGEIEEYCTRHKLTPRIDTTNWSMSLLRNRVRHELLPLIQNYNPAIIESLLRLRSIAGDEMSFLEAEIDKAWQRVVQKENNTYIFDKQQFCKLPRALLRQLLRRVIEELLGNLKDIETRHIEAIVEALNKPAGRQIDLPEGIIFKNEYDRYLLGLNPEETVPFPELMDSYTVSVPGKTRIPGWLIECRIADHGKIPDKADRLTACFDSDKVGNNIKIRMRRRGDRFQPLGMNHLKRVGEFMLDARIPRSWRDRIPIIYTPQQIIWVAGWRIDERVKVTTDTHQVIRLKMVRLPAP